jgi:hypothetical protein
MHKINNLQRPVLITTDEVIFHAHKGHTLDPEMISNAIIIAEERFGRQALGYDFYEHLVNQKNTVVTADNLADLQTKVNADKYPGASDVTLQAGMIVNAAEFLNTANQNLWKQLLWKFIAECVMLVALPEGFVQFTSEGAVHKQAQGGAMTPAGTSVTPGLGSMKWAMDKKLMDRIDRLQEALHVWLCKNYADYPLYRKPCDCSADGTPYKRKTNLVMGIYDEDENCGCYD